LHHLQRAEALLEIRRWREAIHELDLHLAKYPGDYAPLCQASAAHAALGELQDALDRANQAVQSWPEGDWAYRLQSMIFTENGEFKRAYEAAEKAASIAPDSPLTLLSLAYAQANHGKLDDAEITANALLEVIPDAAESHETAGYVALKRESLADAEKHYFAALEIDPESVNSLNNLGVVYQERAKKGEQEYKQKALEMFERALKADPSFRLAENNRLQNLSAQLGKINKPTIGILLTWIIGGGILITQLNRAFRTERTDQKLKPLEVLAYYNPLIGHNLFVWLNMYSLMLLLAAVLYLFRIVMAGIQFKLLVPYQRGSLRAHLSRRSSLFSVFCVVGMPVVFYVLGFAVLDLESSPFVQLALFIESTLSLVLLYLTIFPRQKPDTE
jgi:tetratricopeptide (TPR) repeat protein